MFSFLRQGTQACSRSSQPVVSCVGLMVGIALVMLYLYAQQGSRVSEDFLVRPVLWGDLGQSPVT